MALLNSSIMAQQMGHTEVNFSSSFTSYGSPGMENGTGENSNNENGLGNPSDAYFSETLIEFIQQYRQVHGGLSLAVCIFGIIANVLNIIVLSR